MIRGLASRLGTMVLTGAIALTALGAAPEFDLAQLMEMLGQIERSTVAFEETRDLALLTIPVVRRGTLQYARPDRLEMRVFSPTEETTDIVGDRIRIESPNGVREWNLARQPVALAWIDGVRALLAGDTATLMRHFHVTLKGSRAGWALQLEPVVSSVASVLSRIEIFGHETRLTRIEIIEAQGDRISIVIAPPGTKSP